ncbi:EamA family transporter [Rhodococcus sp. 1R11]|uniref:DMT family transporter n=1 Tax=Rhodococcus sp. 1R11 TaxID=2559614 RepID=UPI001071E419|nr:DMT family transporter [Rhodococcus sp. 1R11]TFI42500.1 EamA family transporter [Rhodococcus sp. 1R11]
MGSGKQQCLRCAVHDARIGRSRAVFQIHTSVHQPARHSCGCVGDLPDGLAAVVLALFTDLDGITDIACDFGALIAVAVGLGSAVTGFAFILFHIAVSGLGAVTASSASYMPPVVATIIGVGFLHEPATLANLSGLVLILIAAVAVQLPARRAASRNILRDPKTR